MLRYYVYATNIPNPEVHHWDVYIGEQPPSFKEGDDEKLIKEFQRPVDLHRFLQGENIDQLSIYQSPACSEDLVNDLVQWADLNLSLHNKIIVCEGQDVP